MIFTTKINNLYYAKHFKGYIRKIALQKLIYFPQKATEKALDQYLKNNYKITLNFACRLIALKCKISYEQETNSYIITTVDNYIDKLARLITFGTSKINGSKILRFMFEIN